MRAGTDITGTTIAGLAASVVALAAAAGLAGPLPATAQTAREQTSGARMPGGQIPGGIAARASLDDPGWVRFSGDGGTRVDLPAAIFPVRAGPARRGDGIELRSADGRARMMIYTEENARGVTPAGFLRRTLRVPRDELVYRRVTGRFFAVSGFAGSDIYYSRCNFPRRAAGRMHCVYLAYPAAEKRAWDGIVTRISRSLAGTG
ncbi:hypothetical protein A33M_0541 [Rhodovulum sp. PH10]|uniref:hypothetical protein n=1 Tax=Rhodovulum sp. PH10 TaxID=1187851 RepID=UPI00027C2317|nr:hypothetical protein [Rhodovulum sp. PH10]EJW13049.1 hypothetical protein A33M_0541 [Rhodovulum sp. PH10]